ncbi:unnamed protein product [Malus baccata var. baccata]
MGCACASLILLLLLNTLVPSLTGKYRCGNWTQSACCFLKSAEWHLLSGFALASVLAPCGVNDHVCGRASEWIRNGTEFCHAAGFAVKDDASLSNEEAFCYGGKGSLDLIADSWKASPSEQRWREMPFGERVSWAVGGLVLTAGLLSVRRSQSHNVAALRIRKFEAKISQKSPDSSRSRKNK